MLAFDHQKQDWNKQNKNCLCHLNILWKHVAKNFQVKHFNAQGDKVSLNANVAS